jgi:hypothetical protein
VAGNYDAFVLILRQAPKKPYDLESLARLKTGRWLVCDDQFCSVRNRTRNCHTLLLSLTELRRISVSKTINVELSKEIPGCEAGFSCFFSGKSENKRDVLQNAE